VRPKTKDPITRKGHKINMTSETVAMGTKITNEEAQITITADLIRKPISLEIIFHPITRPY